jgi:hypothetical protein
MCYCMRVLAAKSGVGENGGFDVHTCHVIRKILFDRNCHNTKAAFERAAFALNSFF